MAFDQPTRNRLARFVGDARRILTDEFTRQCKQDYGIDPDSGEVSDIARLTHLNDNQRATARILRATIDHYVVGSPSGGKRVAIERIIREQAFTVLNRLCAIRMAEAREILIESVGKGYQSKGFQLYARVAGHALGEVGDAYRCFLYSVFDEIATDLPALFDRFSQQGRLFPSEGALLHTLEEINHPDIDPLWAEDETIGWLYQYFNSIEERKKMRDESAAPRNSRELAVRNQFFTPRYVVEFLTDNTLGRLWYEMTQGQSRLKDDCRYLVRRPTEIFLKEGEIAPQATEPTVTDLSQEELLRRPVYVPHRPLKDPRDIRLLDPACGSMHFGLYAFDLFDRIYDEAWDIAHGTDASAKFTETFAPFVAFTATFSDKAAFLREVPRLIVERNIHGIDIDPRAVQIAGLSLWLRAQRAWHQSDVKPADRPRITRSNVVCAEPMPGETHLLAEFIQRQFPAGEEQVFGFLLDKVFTCMKLAGEAGSLLRVDEEIRDAVAEAKALWQQEPHYEQTLLFIGAGETPAPRQLRLNLSSITDEHFWERAEQRIYDALETYAEQAETGGGFQRRLFAEDTAQGFAFIDLCRKRYDVALMNPPFGDASLPSKSYIDETYGDTRGDVYKAFVECFHARLVPAGYLGIISSRTGFFLGQSEDWRIRVVLRLFRPIALADLGGGVLDAMVEVAAYVLRSLSVTEARDLTNSLALALEKVVRDQQDRFSLPKWQTARDGLKRRQAVAELEHLEANGFVLRCTSNIVRYSPVWNVVKTITPPPECVFPPLVCFRVLEEHDKETALATAINGPSKKHTFVSDPSSFSAVPGSRFAYWVGDGLRNLFKKFMPLESQGRDVQSGASTMKDFRFLRLNWEVPAELHARSRQATLEGKRWVPLAKGGAFSRYYFDWELVLDWAFDGSSLKTHVSNYRGTKGWGYHWAAAINGHSEYFRPGLTWSRRTQGGLSIRVMPAGGIFGDKGPAIFTPSNSPLQLMQLLAITNSLPFRILVSLQIAFGSYEVGVLERTPIPPLDTKESEELAELGRKAWSLKRSLDVGRCTSHAFILPALLAAPGSTLAERAVAWSARISDSDQNIAAIQSEIDNLAIRLYGLNTADSATLTASPAVEVVAATDQEEEVDEEEQEADPGADNVSVLGAELLAYALGCAFGRWDIRYATGERDTKEQPDPFAPLPVCSLGELQNAHGMPLGPADIPPTYPVQIPWDGILVDDPDHPLDIERCVRRIIEIIWKHGAGGIEQEVCQIMAVTSLRSYFRKPTNFFADHLQRYSKSRRQAPIFWPLSTASGGYTLWIYYHRLCEQSLFKAINDFVEPKLLHVSVEASRLRTKSNRSSADETALEQSATLEIELREFRDELLRIAKFWKPNLNDGVQIAAAPLWKLFQLKPWQKKLKETWESLEAGDYDWAHLAYSIWPARVRENCKTDKSLAIAHGLDDVYQEPPASTTKKPGKRKVKIEDEQLIQEPD